MLRSGYKRVQKLSQAPQLVHARLQVCYLYVSVCHPYIACVLPVYCALVQKLSQAQQLVQARLQVTGADKGAQVY